MRFIDPQTDFAFKKIFGSEQSKPILISFLNALIYKEEPKIIDLVIIPPEQAAKILGLRDTYLDVKAILNDRTKAIIQIQCLHLYRSESRILYDLAQCYTNQLVRGQRYEELNPVISLTITKFQLFDHLPNVISYFEFKERNNLINYPYGDITMIFVELPKFQKELEDLANITDKWIYFMKKAGSLEMVPEKLGEITEIQLAFEIANESGLTRDELDKLYKQEGYRLDQERLQQKAQEAEEKAQEAERKLQAERERFEQQLQQEREGKKKLLLLQLSRTIGEIDQETKSKIDNLSPEKLNSLSEVFLDFENISDLINWLQ